MAQAVVCFALARSSHRTEPCSFDDTAARSNDVHRQVDRTVLRLVKGREDQVTLSKQQALLRQLGCDPRSHVGIDSPLGWVVDRQTSIWDEFTIRIADRRQDLAELGLDGLVSKAAKAVMHQTIWCEWTV